MINLNKMNLLNLLKMTNQKFRSREGKDKNKSKMREQKF